MSLFTATVNNPSPALEHRASELALIAQALATAAQVAQSNGGVLTSGNIIGNGGVTIGTWSYSPVASS